MAVARRAAQCLGWCALASDGLLHSPCQRTYGSAASSGSAASYGTIALHSRPHHVVLELHRPKQLNALSTQMMNDVLHAAAALDADPAVKAIVITGSGKAFAAGADIKEMAPLTQRMAAEQQLFAGWQSLRDVRKPLIAAVNGYALGGGCELAMLCDLIIASDTAVFGLPELSLGVIPGIGGTMRLPRLVGRAVAMDMVLTGRRLSAAEALAAGLVSRVVTPERLLDEAAEMAGAIASWSAPAVADAKACIHAADDAHMHAGLKFEQQRFWGRFGCADQLEGMDAFLNKRKPEFRDL